MVIDVYPMKTDEQFVNTLEENIRKQEAMNKLVSDSAEVEISNTVLDVLRTLCIGSWKNEARHQHQNSAKRGYNAVKTTTNTVLDRPGAPSFTWLICLLNIYFVLNNTF